MKIITSKYGFALFFDDKKDLKKVIADLKGFLNRVEENKVEKPYIYFTFDNEFKGEEKNEIVQKLINKLKKGKL